MIELTRDAISLNAYLNVVDYHLAKEIFRHQSSIHEFIFSFDDGRKFSGANSVSISNDYFYNEVVKGESHFTSESIRLYVIDFKDNELKMNGFKEIDKDNKRHQAYAWEVYVKLIVRMISKRYDHIPDTLKDNIKNRLACEIGFAIIAEIPRRFSKTKYNHDIYRANLFNSIGTFTFEDSETCYCKTVSNQPINLDLAMVYYTDKTICNLYKNLEIQKQHNKIEDYHNSHYTVV